MADLVGQTLLERYQVEAFIGRGGMAEVYKIWDKQRAVDLAMKLLRDDLAEDKVFLRRFTREAGTLGKLQHPNIVRYYGLEQQGRLAFMLMEFIEGHTLRTEIFESGGPMALGRVNEIVKPIFGALHYAHQEGFVHCDIKPGNMLIDRNDRVFVADFGIARMMDTATQTMVGMGTPAYMSPEQIRGEDPVAQSDVYAMGAMIYEMLAGGMRPFSGRSARAGSSTAERVRWEQLHADPPPLALFNKNVPAEVEQVIQRMLSKEASERYPSAIDAMNALQLAIGDKADTRKAGVKPASQTQAATEYTQAERPERLSTILGIVGGAIAACILLALGAFFIGDVRSPDDLLALVGVVEETSIPTDIPLPTSTPLPTATPVPTQAEALPAATATAAPVSEPTVTPIPSPTPIQNEIVDEYGHAMVLVEAGEFLMGVPDSRTDPYADDDEFPQHLVYLSSYYIDKYEVTFTQYNACSTDGRCAQLNTRRATDPNYADHPVTFVTWDEANIYCGWRGGRLPTEAEWEKAARWDPTSGEALIYPWGFDRPSQSLANTEGRLGDTMPVGSHSAGASPYGAEDMIGNVWEWVWDWYEQAYYRASPPENPRGPHVGFQDSRVIRGGDGTVNFDVARASNRDSAGKLTANQWTGFRCIVEADF